MSSRKKYSSEELAEALVFPIELTASQKKEAAAQLTAARKKSQSVMSEADKMALQLFQLKFQMENYLESKTYDPTINFGYFLKRYIDILDVKRKKFSEDISIDETQLSQLINMHRTPPDYISIRLELHSNNIIPADYWFKLIRKEKEHQIKTDKKLRQKERKFVRKLAIKI